MDNKAEVFVNLAKQLEALKEAQKRVVVELNNVMADIGVGQYVQDPLTLTVYKIVKPTGTFIEYKTIGYERTAQGEEKRGGLSKKEAQEAGFTLAK